MAVSTRNSIVTNGLVLYLDAANSKSLPAPPSTNLMVQSQNFTAANWFKVRASVTASATTAPDGTLTGTRLVNDTSTNTHYLRSDGYSFTAGETYTVSFYAKAAELTWVSFQINEASVFFATVYIDLANGVLGNVGANTTATIQNVGNGWYRTSVTRTVVNTGLTYISPITSTGNGVQSYTGDGVSGVYIWGVQLEKLPYVTPYIPTTTTSVSRNTWSDVSGNGNNGTLSSSSFDATNGGNIFFSGTGSLCDFTVINFPDATAFTAETVIVIPTFAQTSNRVHWLSGVGGNSMMIFRSAEFFMFNEAGGINALAISYTFNINTIYHVIVTRDTSNNVSLYINGSFINSGTRSGQFRWVTMGRLGSGTAFCSRFNSYTNKIYNRALSAQEVLQNYNAIKTRFNLT